MSVQKWKKHIEEWGDCQRCPLFKKRKKVCHFRSNRDGPPLYRGRHDVVFIGEAPGPSENVLGKPFVGPAGHLLDQIIEEALAGRSLKIGFTNIVGCIPLNEFSDKFVEPPDFAVKACTKKLKDILIIMRPKLVVAVGTTAKKWLSKFRQGYGLEDTRMVEIQHPAFILRSHISQQGLLIQRCRVTLDNAFDEVCDA